MKTIISMLLTLLVLFTSPITTFALPANLNNTTLIERQSCIPGGSCTKLEGNGDPHQWILEKQLSLWLICGDTACSLSESLIKSYSINADTHGLDWISGGFDVVQSVHTDIYTECAAQPGQRVCVKAAIWHTDYSARGGVANSCALDGCQEFEDYTIIRSPNAIHNGVIFRCKYDGDCGDQGSETWTFGGQGGPPTPAAEREVETMSIKHTQKSDVTASVTGNIGLAEPQAGCLPPNLPCLDLEGDGSPRQWVLHKQLSGKMRCSAASCPIPTSKQEGYTVLAYTSGASQWIDGGFAVAEEVHTGTFDGCTTAAEGIDGPGVCVYAEIGYTDYMVRAGNLSGCLEPRCDLSGHSYHFSSPNKILNGVQYRCSTLCGDKGDEWWEDTGLAIGPP